MNNHKDDEVIGPDNETWVEPSIDLNVLFSEKTRDLNRLFPDAHAKQFLKDVKKCQRGVDRFLRGLEMEDDMGDMAGGGDEVS